MWTKSHLEICKVFNSVGIAFGSLIAFSSYNKFRGPVLRDTLIVTLVDAGVSLLCGVAVFAVLGNLAHEQGKNVEDVVADGEVKTCFCEASCHVDCRAWTGVCGFPSCIVTDALPSSVVGHLLWAGHLSWH